MPKLKSHRGAAKRFRTTASGKFKRGKAFKAHILTKKSPKRKRQLDIDTYAAECDERTLRHMLPYGRP